ncbi:ABC transporter ATP-binding protein [Deferribacter autotrophicus]|uniref:ABC transporter ATP-binding protein n=1 Tax=Deferribacter autotrophicus TaxID=500465 RepID=A0A5A8F7J5_9BACT|nr:ABC transporter ATP-binding protein [Deferribacter autotrophicus]KAA0259573.1 ABC transporter ATP-binding protein [Deferribacter autotrophicus]
MLRTEHISVNFGGIKALDDVNIRVESGNIVALIGPNGAGKTTLFNVITGFISGYSGKVFFQDEDISHVAPNVIFQKGISRTFQNLKIINDVTIKENLILGLLKKKIKKYYFKNFFRMDKNFRKEIEQTLENTLELFGISEWKDKTPDEAPYGVLKYLELARSYLSSPSLLLLDEPAAGLNNFEKEKMIELIKKLKNEGITVLMVEHDMNFISSLADKVYCLNFGKIIAEGSYIEVRNNPDVMKAYLGDEDA